MFQDFEGFPRAFYSESSISDAVFSWLELDESDREVLAAYQDGIDSDGTIEAARDAFMGTADTEESWAESFLDDTGQLSELPEWARNYFDYAAYARDARMGGDVCFVRHNGTLYVFHNS